MRRLLLLLAACACCAAADLPSSYDLRDVDGEQFVNTRAENQIGAGPCWAFAAMVAIESNVLKNGLWTGAAADLDLSQQWLRMNESKGYGGTHTWDDDPDTMTEGFTRDVNAGGNWQIPTAHMARLHGPVLEVPSTGSNANDLADGRPFVYVGDLNVNGGYYDSGIPKWPARGYYDPEFRLRQTLYWDYDESDVTQVETLKGVIMIHGALYVSFAHKDAAFTVGAGPDGLGTYYDDGNVPTGGLGGHAINFVGWDDSVDTAASANGAWLVKQSHPTATAPSYFWLAYTSTIAHVVSYRMAAYHNESVFSHANGAITGTDYKPDNAHQRVAASVYPVGASSQTIGSLSFETDTATAYTVRLYASLSALQDDADPLAEVSGTSDGEGFHTVILPQPVTVAANSSFVVNLATPNTNLPWIYYSDSPGATTSVERTHAGEHYYLDSSDGIWKDIYEAFDGDYNYATTCAWSLRAYTVGDAVLPTRSIAIAVHDGAGVVVDVTVICDDDPDHVATDNGDYQVFAPLDCETDHHFTFVAAPTVDG